MKHIVQFDESPAQRKIIWENLIKRLEHHYQHSDQMRVAPHLEVEHIINHATKYNFNQPVQAIKAIDHVLEGLDHYHVHTLHPGYYGLFNPRPTFSGILADVITAVYNPQMAAWSHAPFAAEAENHCIDEMAKKFGYDVSDGTFCSGGAEANLTAVLCALQDHFPAYVNQGIRSLEKDPVMYCSAESHHSVVRAAKVSGIGLKSVRKIPCNERQEMDTSSLYNQIQRDISLGMQPFMVVANAGSTGSGAIDPLQEIGDICKNHHLWYHVDAAYGGAMIIEPTMKDLLKGIEESDSLTIDIHKWYSAPMGTGLYITKHPGILSETFSITADYMPKEANEIGIVDPYTHSIQWSRRFIGLKFYLSLLILGWEGLAEMIRRTTQTGEKLKVLLKENDWEIVNNTALPIVCFTDGKWRSDPAFISTICKKVIDSGEAWISIYNINNEPTLRACITNYNTGEHELKLLVRSLNQFRSAYDD